MTKRLFLIRTPLQALIVKAIQAIQFFDDDIIYIPTSNNDKHRHYFDSLEAIDKAFVSINKNRGSDTYESLKEYFKIPARFRKREYDEIHLASIGTIAFSLLLRKKPLVKIGLFDDGIFNLDCEFLWKWIHLEPALHRIMKTVLRAPSNAEIADKISIYHTIFSSERLVLKASKILQLKLFQVDEKLDRGAKLTVILGTPAHLFPGPSEEEYKRVMEALQTNIFLPHPAGHETPRIDLALDQRLHIKSQLHEKISEEILLDLCRLGYRPTVIGFGSTTLVNMSEHMDTINIVIDGLNDKRASLLEGLGVRPIPSVEIRSAGDS